MKYKVVKSEDSELYYYKGEDGKWYGEGYRMAYDFESNGFATIRKEDELYYYINDKFKIVSEGFVYVDSFAANGLAVVEKEDELYYYINDKFKIVSEGYKEADAFDEEGLAKVQKANGKWYLINDKFEIVGTFDSRGKLKSEEEFKLDLYLEGEIDVYDLPDKSFVGKKNLETIVNKEKKDYEYFISMAGTEDQMKKILSEYSSRADFIRGRAYEADLEAKREECLKAKLF